MAFLKMSKIGLALALIFILLAAAAFVTHLYSVKTNPADSGESGILFFLFTVPWGFMVPNSLIYSEIWDWLAYPLAWVMVIWNGFLLYCVGGGIRLRKGSGPL